MNEATIPVEQPPHQQTQQEWQTVAEAGGVSYLAEGAEDAAPLVFLHGIGGAARQFAPQLRHFGQTHRAIAWDMPGYGGSAPLPLVSIDALAASLVAFVRALGLERPVLVGHSLGGWLIQRVLAELPDFARATVLSQTSAAFGGRDPAWGERFVAERIGPLDAGHTMLELAPGMADALLGDDPDPAARDAAIDTIAHTPDATYRDTVLAMPGFDQRHALPRIAVPTLLVAGSRDANAPVAGMERMAAQVPGAELVVVEGSGHLVHLERPAAFNAAVERFLARV